MNSDMIDFLLAGRFVSSIKNETLREKLTQTIANWAVENVEEIFQSVVPTAGKEYNE